MSRTGLKALGDWIQLIASIGVIAGIVLMVLGLVIVQVLRSPSDSSEDPAERDPVDSMVASDRTTVTPDRATQLRELIEVRCGVCHGLEEAGGIGPTLTSDELVHLSTSAVAMTILQGRPEKGMPPWEPELSRADADWIAGHLKGDSEDAR